MSRTSFTIVTVSCCFYGGDGFVGLTSGEGEAAATRSQALSNLVARLRATADEAAALAAKHRELEHEAASRQEGGAA